MDSGKHDIKKKQKVISEYYQHNLNSQIATRLSLEARKNIYGIFEEKFNPSPKLKILDIGVTCDRENPESNYFEQIYPYKDQITCVGTEDASWIEDQYPGLTFLFKPARQKELNTIVSHQ